MSKRDAAPTHSWVIGSHVNRLIVRVFWVVIIVVALVIGTIVMKLEDDCTNTYEWTGQVFGYAIDFHVRNEPMECR